MMKTLRRRSPDSLDEYTRKYAAWTERGVEAYHSTRRHLLTLFGGGKGGSKTVTAVRIIQTDISNFRDGVFVVMRKNYSVLHKTTKQSFERFFPKELIVRKTKHIWYCVNNNEIWWWAADRSTDPDYEKTRGIEASAIVVDEASQFAEDFYQILPSLLRRPAYHIDTDEELKGYIYITSNPVPGKNWLKRYFVDPKTRRRDGQHNFIRSLADDNPLLPKGYIKYAFGTMTGPLLAMMRYGDWDVEESEFKIISSSLLDVIARRRVLDRSPLYAGIDIGLGRPDKTVVYVGNGVGEMWREACFEEYDTMKQVDLLDSICSQIDSVRGKVFIDAGSVGKGVSDALFAKYGVTIVPVLFGESAVEEEGTGQRTSYENRRAQLYYWARQDAEQAQKAVQQMESPLMAIEITDELDEEMDNTYYMPLDGKTRLEPKKLIRERLGRSPDDADSFVLCNAARREIMRNRTAITQRPTRERRAPQSSSITQDYPWST